MSRTKKLGEVPVDQPVVPAETSADALVKALVQAIQLTKPIEKKNAVNRKPGSPWDMKDGSKKPKLKRKMYQHGILIDPDILFPAEIELLNKVKVGRFLGNWVKIFRRKDHGIDIDYPVKTASQRMKSSGLFRSLSELAEKCIEEAANPVKDTSYGDDE